MKKLRKSKGITTLVIETSIKPGDKNSVDNLFIRKVSKTSKEKFWKAAHELGLKGSDLFNRMVDQCFTIKQ